MSRWLSTIVKRSGNWLVWWLDILGRNPPLSHDCLSPFGGPLPRDRDSHRVLSR
jgi:hypothetical protein